MSQFNFVSDLQNALILDGETRGPAPRWKKKLEASLNGTANTTRSVLSVSYNTSFSGVQASTKTPGKSTEAAKGKKSTTTPTKTPGGGDRFIPNRAATNFELAHFHFAQGNKETGDKSDEENDDQQPTSSSNTNNNNNENNVKASAHKSERKKLIAEVAQLGENNGGRILCYQNKAPAAPESHTNPLKVVYSIKTPISTKSGSRYIPTTSERILDAPDFINDYYLNLMDWSADNIVAVALGNCVYLWNAASGNIEQLKEYEEGDYACSLSWIQEGQILAIGNSTGAVELWDCSKVKRLRVMDGHSARVGSLAWNSYLVSSGSRDGTIIHHDVRSREHKISSLTGHAQEVCGLKWSTDFKYLASGGNDNLVNVWSLASSGVGTATEPLHKFNEHQAAVRALAWCPWQANTLASGGGTADRCIKFWNVCNGSLIKSVDSKSQVCALLFSRHYKELISAHGFANNQLTIWKYPTMVKQADLIGHTSRVLQMAISPDGSTVISAGADETLRLWNCFTPDPLASKKVATATSNAKKSVFRQSIR
ncbi:cell division cycle protein 20 homolog [Drosophila grimshawi]|uniref:Cell division cycle protein 20 homolog n=1 Tax=Drosophila grimshawi TaxID=7222 RepID=B4JAB6_DROGR|nr:cell division cycle protein 20 homolog [Drosophila grimshawi]EDW03787.1 GH10315 [Drosophila grimshawi]